MKLALNLSLFALFALFTFDNKAISLSNYQINKICKNEKKSVSCIKNLKEKRNIIQKGELIEIPVVPHKR